MLNLQAKICFLWCCSHLHLFQGTMVSKSPRVPLITLVGICQDAVATGFRVWWFEFAFKLKPTPQYPLLILALLIIFTTIVPLAGYTTPIPPQNKRSIFCHDLCILMNNVFVGNFVGLSLWLWPSQSNKWCKIMEFQQDLHSWDVAEVLFSLQGHGAFTCIVF